MASASPQWYLADTQEVQEAKRQFAAAYNEAAARAAPPSAVPAGFEDPSQYSPAAEPYVHVDIPAVPYVHEEWDPESETNVAAPAQPAAPVAAPVAPAAYAPVAPAAYAPAAPAAYAPAAPAAYAPAQAGTYPFNFNFNPFNGYAGYQPYAGYQQAAYQPFPGYQPAAPVAPAAPETARSGCFNWQGAGVPCRTQFNQ